MDSRNARTLSSREQQQHSKPHVALTSSSLSNLNLHPLGSTATSPNFDTAVSRTEVPEHSCNRHDAQNCQRFKAMYRT